MATPVVLPDGSTVSIFSKMEVSERKCRLVDEAVEQMSAANARLLEAGFNAEDPATYNKFPEGMAEDFAFLKNWKLVLLQVFVDPTTWTVPPNLDAMLDVARGVLGAITDACWAAYTFANVEDAGDIHNPKASPGA